MLEIRKLQPSEWMPYKAIRIEALTKDAKAFGSVVADQLKWPDTYWSERLEKSLGDTLNTLLFALDSGAIVGMIGSNVTEVDGEIKVISMYVTESSRGQGISRKLMSALIEELQRLGGVNSLVLDANIEQLPAISLYKSFGFEVFEEGLAVRSDGSTYPEVKMRVCL